MNIRRWIAPSIATMAMVAVHCGGGEDSNVLTPSGAGGTDGSSTSSSGGSAGSSTGGSGTGGSSTVGAGGSATVGSGGGSTGTAGKAGSGGTGGTSADGGGAGGTGGSAGGKADAAAGSGGTSTDGGRSDAPVVVVDGSGGDANACPANPPADGDACTGAEICTWDQIGCACVRAGGGGGGQRREWQCRRVPDAARDPDCPATAPPRGTSCADAGAGTVCRYGQNTFCACNQMDEWVCL